MKKYIYSGTLLSALFFLASCQKESMTTFENDGSSVMNTASQSSGTMTGKDAGSNQHIDLGKLTDYALVFTNGSTDANWQGATKGFVGDVSINGVDASERTSGSVPFAGTIYTNDQTAGAWQNIANSNSSQSSVKTNKDSQVDGLADDLSSAFTQVNALSPTAGFESRSVASLDGLNTQDGVAKTYIINITSGMQVSSQIDITGDAGDQYIFRWDSDANAANGYQGLVKFQSGGAFVPHGGLTPSSFINVAGDIDASGGGSNPAAPYPQGPRYNNGTGSLITGGANFHGGGFFTGYWLTTGDPVTGKTHPLSNAIFVGGWYSRTTQFSMTSGTSAVHIAPPPQGT